ncbi:hypothetical protein QJQ45_018526 [Haematococcus lacustris]|nr:hypothetical protein QJQ45_018526 [Haematococcus lacustris]
MDMWGSFEHQDVFNQAARLLNVQLGRVRKGTRVKGAVRQPPIKSPAFLEALNAAHHPLVLYPPQQIRTVTVLSVRSSQPSSYAGVAKATRDLEQHTDTYLDRSGPEISNITAGQPCAVRGVVGFVCCHGVPLLALYCNMRTTEQFVYYLLAWHAACDMLHLYNDFACQFQVPYPGGAAHHSVHELGLQRERMGQSDKDTCAGSNAIKAKLRTARQLLKEAALYQALGSGEDAAAVSIIEELQAMVRGEPAP